LYESIDVGRTLELALSDSWTTLIELWYHRKTHSSSIFMEVGCWKSSGNTLSLRINPLFSLFFRDCLDWECLNIDNYLMFPIFNTHLSFKTFHKFETCFLGHRGDETMFNGGMMSYWTNHSVLARVWIVDSIHEFAP
jgi:hypothetical protein